jgi:hypothetical protein
MGDTGPTAHAVGYHLSALRTWRMRDWLVRLLCALRGSA